MVDVVGAMWTSMPVCKKLIALLIFCNNNAQTENIILEQNINK
jgi:hypothetical protein